MIWLCIYDGRLVIICLFLAPGWGTSVSSLSSASVYQFKLLMPSSQNTILQFMFTDRVELLRWLNCPWNSVRNNPYGTQYSIHMEVDHRLVSSKNFWVYQLYICKFLPCEGQKNHCSVVYLCWGQRRHSCRIFCSETNSCCVLHPRYINHELPLSITLYTYKQT